MKTINIESVAQLHELVEAQDKYHPVFRGEDSDSYKLRPRIGRFKLSEFNTDRLTAETDMLGEFKRRSYPYLVQIPQNEWDWLALAQHQVK